MEYPKDKLRSRLNSSMAQQQIKDQYNEKNTAYADAATIAVTRISETASEQEKQDDNYQD